jgi:hypothetical protein
MKNCVRPFLCIGVFALWSHWPALGQCTSSIFWNGGTPAAGIRNASGTILGTVGVTVSSSGSFAAGRPGYGSNLQVYNGFTWRSLMTFRGASFAGGTFSRFDLSVPLGPAYIHVRVADIRGDGFNTEHQRVQGFLDGVPVAANFEDPVNGAFITGGNVINGASTTTSTVQSAMRAFFAGPVNRIVVTCNGLSDYVVVDLFARCDILLPFQLIRFDAEQTAQGVELEWTSAQEEGVLSYAVERSPDARTWSRIGQVDAIRAPGQEKHYRFTDRLPLDGVGYYRLKSIETIGPGQYSKVLTVRKQTFSGNLFRNLYPNPATDHLVLDMDPSAAGSLQAIIRSADGRTVMTFALAPGKNRLSCNQWPRGYYFVSIVNNEGLIRRERLVLR